jgi:hypothetical protein
MLQGYADDSGSDGTRIPFVIAGYILPAERWAQFSDDWQAQLDREPAIEYFKMSEAVIGEGQFRGLAEEFRKCKVRDLISVIRKHDPTGVHAFLRWNEWREEIQPVFVPPFNQPYPALFFLLLDTLVNYEKAWGKFPEKMQMDFDDQGSLGMFALSLLATYRNIPSEWNEIMEGSPRMLSDKKYLPLQAADMLAWTIRRHLDPEPSELDSRWLWVWDELFPTIWAGPGFNRETLRYWADRGRV